MKPKAAIFNVWPKQFPALKAFAESHPDYLILVPFTRMRTVPMFSSFLGRLIPWDELLPPPERAALASSAAEMGRFLEGYTAASASGNGWRDLCEGAGVPPSIAAESLFQDVEPKLLEQMVQMESLEMLLDRLDIRVAAVTEEFTRMARSLAIWVKARGIPLLHISHSLGMGAWYTVHNKLVSDALAVYGPVTVDAPMATGFGRHKIFVSGNPDWIAYRVYRARKPGIRKEILDRYFQGEDAPLVVFGTTYSAELTATEAGKDPSAQGRAFFHAIAALKRSGARILAAVKMRLSNDKTFEDEYARIAAEEGLLPSDYRFIHRDLESLMLAADVVVSVDSTLSADALLADTASINLINEEGLRKGPYYPPYTGILECRAEDLAGCISKVIHDSDFAQGLARLRRRSWTAYQGGGEGEGPTLLLADLIGKLALGMAYEEAAPSEGESMDRQVSPREGTSDFEGEYEPGRMTVVIRPTANLSRLKSLVDSLKATCRPGFEVYCLVAPEQYAAARNVLPEGTGFLQTGGSPHSREVLGLLASAIKGRGGVVAFLDAHVRLPAGWDRLLSLQAAGKTVLGPLSDQMTGTQCIYHYLPAEKVDPDQVDAVSRLVRMRFPGMTLSADWLYNHALVFGKDLLAEISRLPDSPTDDNFLGLGRKLALAGARLLVAKDVYAAMEP